MKKSIIAEKRALSPVIATVILISVTIVVAVSVAYWMGSIAGGYTSFEQIELPTAYAKYVDDLNTTVSGDQPGWEIYISLKNTGSADATIDNVFINSVPIVDLHDAATTGAKLYVYSSGSYSEISDYSNINIQVTKGGSQKIKIVIFDDGSVEGASAGTRMDFKLHSAAGRDYPAQVKLP